MPSGELRRENREEVANADDNDNLPSSRVRGIRDFMEHANSGRDGRSYESESEIS